MKNRNRILALLTAVLLLACTACGAPAQQEEATPAPTAAEAEETPEQTEAAASMQHYTPGTYTATGSGNNGDVVVSVTFSEDAITAVAVDSHNETSGIGDVAVERLPERIVEKQSLMVNVISGATNTSKAILEAVEACAVQAGGNIDALKIPLPEEPAPEIGTNDEVTDIVVVGGGGSGITAALTAHEAGKKVILVEKMPLLGGNTILATTQMWAAGSSMQKQEGYTETAEDFYQYIMTGKGATMNLDPDATMLMCQRSGEMVDWLLEIGVQFGRVFNTYSHGPADGGAPGPVLMAGLSEKLNEQNIDYRLNARATSILMEDGKAKGITVEDENGTYIIHADAVILATGGFANNSEMVSQYDPRWQNLGCNSSSSQTGDGILMAQEAGAALRDMANITINPTVYYDGDHLYSLTALRSNGAILVNNAGKRFTNEEGAYTGQAEALLQQDKEEAFMIFDQTMIDNVGLIKQYSEQGMFVVADTIEALAAELGVDEQGLAETIRIYKTYVEGGEDKEFGRSFMTIDFNNAPYYGVKVYPSVQTTSGGIVINLNAEVLTESGEVIEGLYACGATTSDGTKAVSPLTETFVFGRIAGESACAYVGE